MVAMTPTVSRMIISRNLDFLAAWGRLLPFRLFFVSLLPMNPPESESFHRGVKSHLRVHLKQEFIPANVGHHDNGRQVLQAPGRSPRLIDRGVLGALDKDAGRGDVCKAGALLADEGGDLVEGAVDLGPDVAGIEAPPLLINGRGAGDLDQGNVGLPDERSPGKGRAVSESRPAGPDCSFAEPGAGTPAVPPLPGGPERQPRPVDTSPRMPVLAGSCRRPSPCPGMMPKFPIDGGAGPVELRVPGQDVGEVKPGPHHVAIGGSLSLEQPGGVLDHTPGLEGAGIGPIAVCGQSLEILQEEKGSLPSPPAPAHGLSLFPDGPDRSWRYCGQPLPG